MNKEAFKIDIKDIEECRKEVKVEVPQQEVSAAYDKSVAMVRQQVNLPGFRQGKAPKSLVIKRFGKELEDQVRQDIFRAVMESIFEDEDNAPVSQPEVEQGEISAKSDFEITLKFDVSPKFELPDYKALGLTVEEFKADDKEIEAELAQVKERFGKLEVVERAAAEDDFVKCTFSGEIKDNKEEIPESANGILSGEDRWIPLKETSLLPDALKHLDGKKAGDEVTWTASFAEDHPVDFLKGKEVEYKCSVNEVHGRVIPELDDELAKQAGAESLEDLKAKTLEGLEGKFNAEKLNENKEVALAKLLDGFECTLPPTVLENEIHRMMHTLKHEKNIEHDCNDHADHEHTEDCGHSDEDKAQEAELKKEAEEKAQKELKTRFLLSKIAKEEEVKVEEYELQYQIYMMAQQYNVDPKVFTEQLTKNGSINEFKEQILIDKALAKVVELSTSKDK
ncbi:MAG: trigger factor [Lentisphaeraceae bacterium]|nr:trigger factor [Lentisphaeraceae bacterium]